MLRDFHNHWITRLIDWLYGLGAIVGLAAAWHLGWPGVIGLILLLVLLVVVGRLLRKRIRTAGNST